MHHGILIIFALSHSDRVWVQTTGWETNRLVHVTVDTVTVRKSKMEVQHLLTHLLHLDYCVYIRFLNTESPL